MAPLPPSSSPRPIRVHLHSPDDLGLGGLRRTLTIAESLRRAFPSGEFLVTSGSPFATHFGTSEGVDLVKLPSIHRAPSASAPRVGVRDPAAIRRLRAELLAQVHSAYEPEVLLVDQQPLGQDDELAPLLDAARGASVRTVLGLYDVLDTPDAMRRAWGRARVEHALREQYDAVCVYGTPQFCDLRAEQPILAELGAKLHFTGFVARSVPPRPPRGGRLPRVLVTGGSGESGSGALDAALDAFELAPASFELALVLGPLLDARSVQALQQRAALLRGVRVHLAPTDVPELLASADAVVAVPSYNTAVEVLQSRLPAVFCPRSFPCREQLRRCERLAELGLARCLPNPGPEVLRATIEELLQRGLSTRALPAFDGGARLAQLVCELADEARPELRLGRVP